MHRPHNPGTPTDPAPGGSRESSRERLAAALRLLAAEVEQRIALHPGASLVAGRAEALDLAVAVPTDLRDGRLEPALRQLDRALDAALDGLVRERTVFRPGRAFCLRCGRADCEHSAPPNGRQVFAGYAPTGLPRFVDFAQLALERRDPRVDSLFREPPGLIALTLSEGDLCQALAEPFRRREDGFRLLGQVVAGWYEVRATTGVRLPFAVGFQILSVRGRGGRRRLFLNVLGAAPDGEPLEALYDRLGSIPWTEAVRFAQGALAALERSLHRGAHNATTAATATTREFAPRRLEGILDGLARRLEKDRRARDRRTQHAEQRHGEGDRPTGLALADLARATSESLFVDVERDTMVVLGERGRAHVFNRTGRHVTSLRLGKDSLSRRRERGQWRPARAAEIQALYAAVKASSDPTD